ncbi:MAG: hypothetical protein QOE58_2625 [Actinomycetota bacterium]|jgi:hypothetical protein|nr:hypothetical protein [Actinomycetota bacterium]
MSRTRESRREYEVVLSNRALQALRRTSREDQALLVRSLRTNLGEQTSDRTLVLDDSALPAGQKYFATALPSGHVAVYRRLTDDELARQRLLGGKELRSGPAFFLFDLMGG